MLFLFKTSSESRSHPLFENLPIAYQPMLLRYDLKTDCLKLYNKVHKKCKNRILSVHYFY